VPKTQVFYFNIHYKGTKIDQLGDNTTEIKHKISETRKAKNALNSIWWHKILQKIENYIFIKPVSCFAKPDR
jgi:hypothetical protein